MMRSMYSGVSGLRIHQTKMDVIGNNIANVNTVGFKSSRVTFSEVFSQTVQSATGAGEYTGGTNPMQIGLGASVSSIDINMTAGASQRTDNPLDLQISGDGFFIVSDATGNKFTRAGAFNIDEAGNLVNSDGLYVMGWPVNTDTNEIQSGTVEKMQVLSAENTYSEPSATTDVTLSGNINMNDSDLAGDGLVFVAQFYDSLGYQYSAEYKITETATPNVFDVTLDAGSIVDSEGNSAADLDTTFTNAAVNAQITFNTATGKIDETIGTTFEMTGLDSDYSSFTDPLLVDFSGLTMFSGNSTVEAVAGDSDGLGAGNQAGTISGYEVGTDGTIVGRYTNGETKTLGQLVIANFDNPAGLQKIGDNLFEATNNSGSFDGIGDDITTNGGTFNAGVLEMSNVDLSYEFTEMITTQRGFQANSRVITTSDEILQELVNLK